MENMQTRLLIMLLILAFLCYAPNSEDTSSVSGQKTEATEEESINFFLGVFVIIIVIVFIIVAIDLFTTETNATTAITYKDLTVCYAQSTAEQHA